MHNGMLSFPVVGGLLPTRRKIVHQKVNANLAASGNQYVSFGSLFILEPADRYILACYGSVTSTGITSISSDYTKDFGGSYTTTGTNFYATGSPVTGDWFQSTEVAIYRYMPSSGGILTSGMRINFATTGSIVADIVLTVIAEKY